MTEQTFHEGMDLLIASKRPYKWNNDSKGAYWAALKNYDDTEFYAACKRLNITAEEMPSVGALSREINPPKVSSESACVMCDDGMVRYVYYDGSGVRYDRWAACTCEAGHKRALSVVRIMKLKADATSTVLMADQIAPDTYKMPAVRQRLGDKLKPERWVEKKSIYDVEIPKNAPRALQRKVKEMKEGIIRMVEEHAKQNVRNIDDYIRQAS